MTLLQLLSVALVVVSSTSSLFCCCVAVRVKVKLLDPIARVDERELSLTWDLSRLRPESVRHWTSAGNLNLRSQQVQRLVRELRPLVFRVSGTVCDAIQFGADPEDGHHVAMPLVVLNKLREHIQVPVNVHEADWDAVADFVGSTKADLVLGLNQLTRDWPESGGDGCAFSPSCTRKIAEVCSSLVGPACRKCIVSNLQALEQAGCQTNGVSVHDLRDFHDVCEPDALPKRCAWNPLNARRWIHYNKQKKLRVYGYELGNEPGCFMQNVGMKGGHVAVDFTKLRHVIQDVFKEDSGAVGQTTIVPKVIGMDVGGCRHVDDGVGSMSSILSAAPDMDILNFHHYTLGNGRKGCRTTQQCTVDEVVKAALSGITEHTVDEYIQLIRKAAHGKYTGTPVWIGEGAGYFGQTLDYSFAACYSWLNILRVGGVKGVSLFAHQNIMDLFDCQESCSYNGNVRRPTLYKPTAGYWFAFLYKRLMGTRVFESTQEGLTKQRLILAARSLRGSATVGFTLAVANLEASPTQIQVDSAKSGYSCSLYELSPTSEGDPRSKFAKVNGREVEVTNSGGIPIDVMSPKRVSCTAVTLQPMAIGFIVAAKMGGGGH